MADGLTLRTKTNVEDVLRGLDAFASNVSDVAMGIAVNKLGEQAKVAGLRAIRKRYGLTIAEISPYFDFVEASRKPLAYTIVAKGKGFPLSLFKPRIVRGRGGGVSVVLVGRRVLIPHAFIFAGQVFARGTYNANALGGTSGKGAGKRRKAGIRERTGRSAFEPTGERLGRFAFGRRRFPITLLRTTTPPSVLLNDEIVKVMNERIAEQAPAVIRNAIRFATRGGGG